jgi:hypothetical protein
MNITNEPLWIQRLLTRLHYSCAEPEFISTRQDCLREFVIEEASSNDDGYQKLRDACISHLNDDNYKLVVNAISCLFVVGEKTDVPLLEPLSEHSDEAVQKAARCAIFEIRKRKRSEK